MLLHLTSKNKHTAVQYRTMCPWEYALGDKMYMMDALSSCTEFKDYGRLTPDMLEWNNVLQFYRGRNEHEVAFVKDGRAASDTRWCGSYAELCAVLRLVVHLCHSVRWRDACWARDMTSSDHGLCVLTA